MKRFIQALLVLAFMAGASFAKEQLTISAKEAYKLIGKPGVVFVSGDSETAFENGHIKGSVNMYAHHLHHSDIMGRMHCAPLFQCPEDAAHLLGTLGISNDTTVIAYDNWRGPNATGVLAFMKSYGHKKVYVLDGGVDAIKALDPNQKKYDELKAKSKKIKKAYKKAKKAGKMDEYKKLKAEYKAIKKEMKKLAKKLIIQRGIKKVDLGHGHYAYMCPESERKITPTEYHMDPKKFDYSWVAGKDEVYHAVLDRLKKGDKSKYVVIDTRSMIEIIGERKMDNVARGGHIPTAKFIEWKNITDFKRKLSFRDKKELEKVFKKYGVTKDKVIYAYCQVGTGRGSDIITALKLLGYPNAKVYSGSWDEWGNDMNLPIRR
ncbi:sulfurtransferase [Nitratiruptor tergarcus]|uniref:Thiosulfate/3-mercaptopyruvate sulfurtransferase n=1 Tax=Nitratiruptor tergarcus DSM 16512 TaxID=1069081 RepID=A0A1W1WQZ5_9BACT|nr:rhodanese-like domain-containing protein [Nitratiruptor tergarcus]SMC08632.1 thiosulfate/3-mercaptopyruvate sulfurtransferase [Nitratiruptor tergarcus DSM 16512]